MYITNNTFNYLECGGELKSSEGYLANPGWPNSYPNATECTWTISAGFGKFRYFARI